MFNLIKSGSFSGAVICLILIEHAFLSLRSLICFNLINHNTAHSGQEREIRDRKEQKKN